MIPTAQAHTPANLPGSTAALNLEMARRAEIRAGLNPQQALSEQLRRAVSSAETAQRLQTSRQAQQQFAGRPNPPSRLPLRSNPLPQRVNYGPPPVNNAYTPGANYSPGGGSSAIAARNAAAAAGATGAQAAAAARASIPTVITPAMAARGALRASPLIGSGIAGASYAGAVKAQGGDWWQVAAGGLGAAVGSTLGTGLGFAAGLGTANPVAVAAAPIAGSIAGGSIGGLAGVGTVNTARTLPKSVGGGLANLAGVLPGVGLLGPLGGLLSGWLQPETVSGDQIPSATVEVPGDLPVPFTGGQSPGVSYRIFLTQNNTSTGVRRPEELRGSRPGPLTTTQVSPAPDFCGTAVPTAEVWIHTAGQPPQTGIALYNSGAGSCTAFPWGTSVRIARADGQPDTGGDPTGPLVPVPAPSKAPYYNPLDNIPRTADRSNTPPATAAAPNNDGALSPALRPKAPPATAPAAPSPGPSLPAGDPLRGDEPQTTPQTIPGPVATPDPDTYQGLRPGESATLSGGAKVTATETGYRVEVPLDSPNRIQLPNGDIIGPGQSGDITERDSELLKWLLPALGIGGAAGLATALKIGNPASSNPADSVQVPPTPPQAPRPAPPDTGCRCNAPLVQGQKDAAADINDLRQRLIRVEGNQVNPVSGFGALQAGNASILAFLQTMQNFAAKAWESTRIQKVIDAMTLITVLHNASMISRDVGETLGFALSQALDVLGIDDEEGNALDVNGWFGTSLNNFFEGLFGAERWHGLNELWNKTNAIISSATMIVWTLRSIHDGTQEVLEWTAENTGKIGNALKKWGVVGERAYPWMSERVKAQDKWRRKFGRILDGLETADDTASSYAMVVSEISEITQEVSELGEQRQRFTDSVRDLTPGATPDNSDIPLTNDEAAANATAGPEVTPVDMEPGTDGTP